MAIRIIDGLNRHLFGTVAAVYLGERPVVLLDAEGNSLIGELPERPTITSPIADRTYAVGGNAVTIDAATRFARATSYSLTPSNLPGVTWDGRVMRIEPTTVIPPTTVTLRGINAGGTSEPLTFSLRVNAPTPELVASIPDQRLVTGGAGVSIPLADHFADAASYAVAPTGQGVTIANGALVISAAQARDAAYTVTAANGTGQSVSDTFQLVVAAEVVVPDPDPEPEPEVAQRVVIVTDYAGDCDDAAALAIACQAHRDGTINLLGIVASSNIDTAAAGVRGQLNAYGMQAIPVYAYQGTIGTYNNRISAAVRDIFGVPGQLRGAFADDVTGLRTMLAGVPDGSVKVIDIGAPVSGARLLDSAADAISPLTGMQLVAAKVSALYLMSGRFDSDTTPEYNAAQHVASTRRVYQDWPTPVFAHGGELGRDVFSGPPAATDVLTDPVKAAFESYKSMDALVNDKRHSWDPIAVDQAIYGNQALYRLSSQGGTITVADDGRTTWSAAPAGSRHVVARQASAAAIGAALDARIAQIAIPTPSPRRKISRRYGLSEGTGTTTAPDTGASLTLVGGTTWRTGPAGIALNGISGRLVGPASNDITLADYMVGFVFRMSAVNGVRQLYTMNEQDQRIGHFRVNAGRPEIVTYSGATGLTLTSTAAALATGQWTMATFFVTDTTGLIRQNGVEVAGGTMGRRNKALIASREQVVGAEKNAFTGAFQNFFQGDVIAMEILSGAEASDIASFEARLRADATAEGVTLP